MSRLSVLIQSLALLGASPALAACPIELAVYGEREQAAEIDFRPTMGSATTTNTFKMVVGKDVMLDGVVLWSGDAARPHGSLMHQCPEGDVTGGELAACTVWEGVIYTADAKGAVDLLPNERKDAPATLIFPDLAGQLGRSAIHDKLPKLPWDVFALKGCQE
ncbi:MULTISPECIES: hypothetical protein [Phyllobacteriaceae]|jgi:hypothetical protein|uniref:Uncharacterized protein n=1 Tax=Mesorhizobium hungaricum TaxID=1566387 RepID=A0A1C2DEP5_9HYPH|nr:MULTISPECIES: hypothetical protein [Mesorhizobium]MBN9232708.1 hypothetical protein [Mesorhizobium sp.]MDQ0330306.1 hypothetical protein [Mesorhizobium sp. YL-MeA3-2017]OCX13187.1 hypothetical protein QV13_27070 [Mesorhizobium hungaricum]